MHTGEMMQGVIEHIESNIDSGHSIEDLAERVHLSPFYFQRVFHRLVGRPVMEYVRLRRLARASEDIKAGVRVLDAALAHGFSNHESFTRAFKAAYGITPMEFRKGGVPLQHYLKPDVCLKYTMVDEGVPIVFSGMFLEVEVVTLDSDLLAVGLEGQCRSQDVGQDNPGMMWNAFHAKKAGIPNRTTPVVEMGVSMPGKVDGSFTYMVLSRVDSFEGIHDEWSRFTLPKGRYAVCSFVAEDFHSLVNIALDKAMAYLYSTWLPGSRYEIADQLCCEYYDEGAFVGEAPGMSVWIPVKAKG